MQFQLNATTTVFLGGYNPHNITLFDWPSMTYTELHLQLESPRERSACATLKKRNGDPVVVILGGGTGSDGMEIWDVNGGYLSSIDEIPPEKEGTGEGLQDTQIIPVNGNSQFLLYGGQVTSFDETESAIWKYTLSTDSWEKIGDLLQSREEHAVLPVSGLSCTNVTTH